VVAGNHDFDIKGHITNAIYLENAGIDIEGIKFWGFPYTKIFYNWAYMLDEPEMAIEVSKIPKDIDVLISHGPPKGFLDQTESGTKCGEAEIFEYVIENWPKVCIFGHVHEGYGQQTLMHIPRDRRKKTAYTQLINCSVCNEHYKPVNKPVIINI
jgi:Icc-related predicted phosphoesterase